ncbi:MAG: PatB family C-S lyase [Pseudomonadota bacterium]|nr:PatB family C-S lyase [Pseudomonadota bacterium]
MNEVDQAYSREGTDSEKYELREQLFGTKDVLPMWVADMDLPTPPFVIKAIQQRLEHPLLGYTQAPDSVYQSIIDWQTQHNYQVRKEQIVFTHNVANGFHMAIQAFSKPGETIIVQPPIYPPFLTAAELNDRQTVEAPLKLINQRYEIDFQKFENLIVNNNVKIFLFCNPQNPTGRVWLKEELIKLGTICIKHNVLIISDEIHSDLVYSSHKHIPIASLSNDFADITITLNSPGKTFNLGGLQIGYAIIASPKLKTEYLRITKSNSIQDLNLIALIALENSYTQQGQKWRNALLKHFTTNIERLTVFADQYLPKVKIMQPEASYLVWIDFRDMFTLHSELKHWLINKSKLGLNDGESFGGKNKVGTRFMRINLAIPTELMDQALQQLKRAIKHLEN